MLRLADVRGEGPRSILRPRHMRAAALRVRETMTEFYAIGFVDPSRWADGEFTSLFRLFGRDVRPDAHRDLRRLSIGPLARTVDAVRPTAARLEIRFLGDAGRRPIAAIARADFQANARAGEQRASLRHSGEFVLRKLNGAWRIVAYDVRARIPRRVGAGSEPGTAVFAPGIPAAGPMFVLVIGSDARPRQAVARTRADSLHVVGINGRAGNVSIIGIPRDSWVPIPGVRTDKINASLPLGGPELVVATIERLTGISIDAYVLTGFDGFVRGVGAIGGIDITIPFAISDRYAHARFRPGRTHLGGRQALSLARARHALPNGDFGRSLNQGRLLVAALATLRSEVRAGSAPLVRWALAGSEYVKSDLSLVDMFELLVAAPAFDPRRVRNVVATGRVGNIGGKSVVLLDGRAHAMFRDLRRDGVLGGRARS